MFRKPFSPSRFVLTGAPAAAAHPRDHSVDTRIGPIALSENGERTTPRINCIQFPSISGNSLDPLQDRKRQVVVYPPKYKPGNLVYPRP